MSRQIRIPDASQVRPLMTQVWELVNKALAGGPVVVTLGRDNKTREQEKHYHALINDIAKQVTFEGGKQYAPKVWKTLLVDQFQDEMRAAGTPLRHEGSVMTSLDGRRIVQIRPSTADYLKKEAAEFIEFLHSYGAEHNVRWSDPALKAYEEYQR